MLQRLMKRPGEEQQRLLAQPIVLMPDAPDSEDWRKTIQALVEISPANFILDPEKLAPDLHRYTFGRKRALTQLLTLAFRIEFPNGGIVTSTSLAKAYKDASYTVFRDETECLFKQTITNRPNRGRSDLWCPLPNDGESQVAQIKQFSVAARERAATDTEIRSALTAAEAKVATAMGNSTKKTSRDAGGKVLSLCNKSQDASTLIQNMSTFLDKN